MNKTVGFLAAATISAFAAMSTAATAAGGGVPPEKAFQDRELLPVGVDDDHLACWTWPAKLEETISGRPPAFEECEECGWPGFRLKYGGETSISFHWIWAGRRTYEAVDPASEEARKALAGWEAASEPPLLYYHIDRRTGDASWTPIDFALSRDGRWMLCRELGDSSFRPATGTWNGWLLLAIPEWRRTRILRLFFELPEKQKEIDALRKWPPTASYSPFADGLSDAERVAATGRDTDAPRESLAFPEFGLRFGTFLELPSAANAERMRKILDAALRRLGPPSVRRTVESERKWIHSWAWTKGPDVLVVRIERGKWPRDMPLGAMIFDGPLADLGERGEEAVGRAVQDGWGCFGPPGWGPSGESSNMVASIVYRFSAAPTLVRRSVEIKMDRDSATYAVTDEKDATVLRFRVPMDFRVVRQALFRDRFRLFPKRIDRRVGGSLETITLLAENGNVLASGGPETDAVHWEGLTPYPKNVEDVLEHVLPFAVHEVQQMTLPQRAGDSQ